MTYQFDQGEKKLCFLLEGNKVWLERKTKTPLPLGIKWSALFYPDFQGHNKLSSLNIKLYTDKRDLFRFTGRLNCSDWEQNERLNIKISTFLVSNQTNMSNFHVYVCERESVCVCEREQGIYSE